MPDQREAQLAYSDLQPEMRDEQGRRRKARKILHVLHHFLGRDDLTGLRVLDIGSSTGFIADECRRDGALVVGSDIDQPGLSLARDKFGNDVLFACADGARLPLADASVDIVIFNHVYEHVVDADAVMDEIRRVLKPEGVGYFGFANKLGVVEPHYKLPFLSYLPAGTADRYVRAFGRADSYYERFRTRGGLRYMAHGLHIWDYTYTVLAEPGRFGAEDQVRPWMARIPERVRRAATPLIPTFLWVGSPSSSISPRGPECVVPPVTVPSHR
jgi:ubiquinone/menaquinone biosynthesis C-methylase UbiE